jgi:hypothetical protein
MAEPWLSTVEKLTEFFAEEHIEASARRTKFVQRASKITGKLFLALVTFGRWSTPKTTVAQLAAKAAQLAVPVDITPAALQQRMTERAAAFLREVLQSAFTKLHAVGTVCEDGLFSAFGRVHIADSTGFELPASLKDEFPGAGGSGSTAGAKIQLVWDYKSQTFDHFALLPWNVPDNTYVETVVELAQPHSLFLFQACGLRQNCRRPGLLSQSPQSSDSAARSGWWAHAAAELTSRSGARRSRSAGEGSAPRNARSGHGPLDCCSYARSDRQ